MRQIKCIQNILFIFLLLQIMCSASSVTEFGEMKKWHKITVQYTSDTSYSETGSPNPFTDRRLVVTFTNGGTTHSIEGYFAADGNAADSNAASGNKWFAHLAPDKTGTWNYTARFYQGTNVAIADNPGTPVDSKSGSFSITATDKAGRDHRGKGMLQYVGYENGSPRHHLRFAETGEWFLKQGPDSPENLLAYNDFDGDFKNDGNKDNLVKTWGPHNGDWNTGDPSWDGGKGKELIGAVNYISAEGMNSMSFLTMNINGDDKNVFPYTIYGERYRMDVSRLAQWEIVFEHMDKKGIFLHFKTQETENDQLLDGGNLGTQRKLYYRELVARFSHHLALNWNLGEENTNTTAQRKAFSDYFKALDPYDHPVVCHTYQVDYDAVYGNILGYPTFDGVSLQADPVLTGDRSAYLEIKKWVVESRNSGRPWVCCYDETGNANTGIKPDADDSDRSNERIGALYASIMAGGAGSEYYFGYVYANNDLECEDFRSRNQWWDYCRYALQFFKDNNIQYQRMISDETMSSSSNDFCLYEAGNEYIIYLHNGGTTTINLNGQSGAFDVRWFDPRNGGVLQTGTVSSVSGGGNRNVGYAPNNTTKDWLVLVRSSGSVNYTLLVNSGSGDGAYAEGTSVNIAADAAPSGQIFSQWTGDISAVADVNDPTTTVTMPAQNITVSATYQTTGGDAEVTGTIIGTDEHFNDRSKEKAVDGDTGTFFDSSQKNNAWVGYDFGSGNENVITRLRFYPRATWESRMVGGKFQGANNSDFSDAIDFYTISSQPLLAYTEITVSDSTAYRYVRYLAGSNSFGNIAEVDFYGNSGGTTTYSLTVNNGSGDGAYAEGTSVNIAADAAPSGQIFSQWTGDISAVADVNDPTTTVTMPAQNITVSATYQTTGGDAEVTGTIIGTDEHFNDRSKEKAVDGDTGTFFDSSQKNNAWVGYDFGSGNENVITRLRFYPRATWESRMVGGKFQGANNSDFSDAVDFYTISSQPPLAYTEITVSNSTAYRYVRYLAGSNSFGNIAEVDFYGNSGGTTTYSLTVNSGSGDGSYGEGAVVSISADTPPSGQFFDGWSGDTAYLANLGSANTTMTMPAQDITVTATYAELTTSPLAINSGGSTSGSFEADTSYSGGNTYSTGAAIDLSGVSNPAPEAVYQSERWGNFTYMLTGLNANTSYTVRLHLAEVYHTTAGSRVFDVLVNSSLVLNDYDIVAVAGNKNIAVAEELSAVSNGSGEISVDFVSIVDNAKCSGIEVLSSGGSLVAATFDADAEVFTYTDDAFGTAQPSYADGTWVSNGGFEGGALKVIVGGVDDADITDMSGGWQVTFNVPSQQEVTVSFAYRGVSSSAFEADEYGDVMMSVDGILVEEGGNDFIDTLPSGTDTGWLVYSGSLGSLSAGDHTLTIGAFNNKKTFNDEIVEVWFDGVLIE